MRFPLFISVILCARLLPAQQDTVSFQSLIYVNAFGSKKMQPAGDEYSSTAALNLLGCTYYLGKTPFTGIASEKYEYGETTADIRNGTIVSLRSDLGDRIYRYSFFTGNNGSWRAADTLTDRGYIVLSRYFPDSAGAWKQVQASYHDYAPGDSIVSTYLCAEKQGKKLRFVEPVADGRESRYENGQLREVHEYRRGEHDGLQQRWDTGGRLLQHETVGSDGSNEGWFYLFDPLSGRVTQGVYKNGNPAGVWTVKQVDSSLVEKSWFTNGEPDSIIGWHANRQIREVSYHYVKLNSKRQKETISYSRYWYANGTQEKFENRTPAISDTLFASWDPTGKLHSVKMPVNGKVQEKRFHPNGHLHVERYGGVLRDSVYREWDEEGQLLKEHFYDNGRFLRATEKTFAQRSSRLPAEDSIAARYAAYALAVRSCSDSAGIKFVQPWDTAMTVPQSVIDSISAHLSAACLSAETETSAAMRKTPVFLQVPGDNSPHYICYTLVLKNAVKVNLNAPGKVETGNAALDKLLGDAGLQAFTGKVKKPAVPAGSVALVLRSEKMLNLAWLNRQLNRLTPGSRISLYTGNEVNREFLYIAPGAKYREKLVSPAAIVGFRKETRPGAMYSYFWYDVFVIYGDGEVEYLGLIQRFFLAGKLSGE